MPLVSHSISLLRFLVLTLEYQQQFYYNFTVVTCGLFLIKIGRGFFFSHIYARRILYASRVSKREREEKKKESGSWKKSANFFFWKYQKEFCWNLMMWWNRKELLENQSKWHPCHKILFVSMHKWYSCANLGSEIEYTQSQRWWYHFNQCVIVTALEAKLF